MHVHSTPLSLFLIALLTLLSSVLATFVRRRAQLIASFHPDFVQFVFDLLSAPFPLFHLT